MDTYTVVNNDKGHVTRSNIYKKKSTNKQFMFETINLVLKVSSCFSFFFVCNKNRILGTK